MYYLRPQRHSNPDKTAAPTLIGVVTGLLAVASVVTVAVLIVTIVPEPNRSPEQVLGPSATAVLGTVWKQEAGVPVPKIAAEFAAVQTGLVPPAFAQVLATAIYTK